MSSFINTRLAYVLTLGFASGLPLALTGSTMQAWLTTAHVDVFTIGVVSLLGLPYVGKFLWAPIMDTYFGHMRKRRKFWVICTQVITACALFILANLDPATNIGPLLITGALVAFFAASLDIAIDAYRTEILEE